MSAEPILEVNDLHVHYATEAGSLAAVRGVDFSLHAGEALAIVGESGSGKSATAMAIMGLQPENAQVEGSIRLHGEPLLGADDDRLSSLRGNSIAMVFQDPLSSMTPVYTVGEQLIESILVHQTCLYKAAHARALELLDLVGIPEPQLRMTSYPHEFSGGMRQRVLIAMAIANNPDVIIADEPTTALDVTIQAQVLDVLQKACWEAQAALLIITHDLGVVARVADSAMVMYAGKVVEKGSVRDLFYHSCMPYTIGLLGSLPTARNASAYSANTSHASSGRLSAINGHPPTMLSLPNGCSFAPRCPLADQACLDMEPALQKVAEPHHHAACVHHQTIKQQALTHVQLFQSMSESQKNRDSDLVLKDPFVSDKAVDAKSASDSIVYDATSTEPKGSVLQMSAVEKHYPLYKGAVFRRRVGTVYAVDGIDLAIDEGETLGLVGESGCGKSSTALSILDLKPPTHGTIKLFGENVADLNSHQKRLALRKSIQIVFQDPMSSLDPRMPVFDLIAEPLRAFAYSEQAISQRVNELMLLVGLDTGFMDRFAQQLSGGQCQRVCIARALALEPRLVILDEPVSALDVSVRAGIVNLLQDLKAMLGLSYLFVAHDLALVRHIADRVAVMYLGRIVETGSVESVYENPRHPYTRCLLSAMPVPNPDEEAKRIRQVPLGELPNPANPPTGCHFHTRCPKKQTLPTEQQRQCVQESPGLSAVMLYDKRVSKGHLAACHFIEAEQ